MKKPETQTVCGYGCGSSLMLCVDVEIIARQYNVEVETFCGNVATCYAGSCDVIFISKETAQRIEGRTKAPIVAFNNFMNK